MAQAKIALVDDEAAVRKAIGRLLRLADFQVTTYASGEDFLAGIESLMPDCAVLDVHMPGLTGFQVQKRLQSTHMHLPVVFITADESTAESDAGHSPVLHKPFASEELLATIAMLLRTASKVPH